MSQAPQHELGAQQLWLSGEIWLTTLRRPAQKSQEGVASASPLTSLSLAEIANLMTENLKELSTYRLPTLAEYRAWVTEGK